MEKLSIPKNIIENMVDYANQGNPLEACGVLAGNENRVEKFYPMTNTDKSRLSYFMEPEEQFKVIKEIRSQGQELLAIFHSHPFSEARPSPRDIDMAFYSECVYIIVSLMKNVPKVRGFKITDKKASEVEIAISK